MNAKEGRDLGSVRQKFVHTKYQPFDDKIFVDRFFKRKIVQIVTLIQLHLDREKEEKSSSKFIRLSYKFNKKDQNAGIHKPSSPTDSVARCSGDVMTFPLRSN